MDNIIVDGSQEANQTEADMIQYDITEEVDEVELERRKYKTLGTCGLYNFGATCYLNSIIQLLVSTDALVLLFKRKRIDENGSQQSALYKRELKRGIKRTILNERKNNEDVSTEIDDIDVKKKFKNSLTYKLRNLTCIMWGENRRIKPVTFQQTFSRISKTFRSRCEQNDSQECLSLILETIHDEMKYAVELQPKPHTEQMKKFIKAKKQFESFDGQEAKLEYIKYKNRHLKESMTLEAMEAWERYLTNEYSYVEDVFGGLFCNTVKCHACNNNSFKFDNFRIVNVTVPMVRNNSSVTLEECLDNDFVATEIFEGDNKYSCDICNEKTVATKSMNIWNCPTWLIIHLKKYSNTLMKNNRLVEFPIENLDMKKYMSEHASRENSKYEYDLYGISHQSGDLSGGHYTACTKNIRNKMWYSFNDLNVNHIPDNKLQSKLVTREAYILMYKRRSKQANFNV